MARVVVAGVAHQVTQRGNARQFLPATDPERMVYLDLLRQAVHVEGLSVMGYRLEMARWDRQWSAVSWRTFLEVGETESELDSLRQCTHTGRPLGSAAFTDALEQGTQRRWAPQKGGRPRKPVVDERQEAFKFPKATRHCPR